MIAGCLGGDLHIRLFRDTASKSERLLATCRQALLVRLRPSRCGIGNDNVAVVVVVFPVAPRAASHGPVMHGAFLCIADACVAVLETVGVALAAGGRFAGSGNQTGE